MTLTLQAPTSRTVTTFHVLDPHPTPDPAGLARWVARAHRLLASGQIGHVP